jgi:hypothetical protein
VSTEELGCQPFELTPVDVVDVVEVLGEKVHEALIADGLTAKARGDPVSSLMGA